ncbi:hypothetical protein [Haliangium sp. UPWRP_2]|uniref:hypothetical protein n=1 Tax=Haliangium sp. UPWRP_2 TaxID=1931276 RepID=UPI0011B25680|nr:hypothetical protein [Haliangium sp. UPWRP_2]
MKESSQAQIHLHVQVPIDHLDELCREISKGEMTDRLEIEKKEQIEAGILARSPLRQTELLDVIIAFFVNITATAAWEASKARIAQYANRNNAKILDIKIERSLSLPPHQPIEDPKPSPSPKKISGKTKRKSKR